jgi:superfamily II DNA or RNA helicase
MRLYSYQQRALDALSNHSKGKVLMPTGAGKTLVMMNDLSNRISKAMTSLTIVVVAPRILLANQLSNEFEEYLKNENICIAHVHSGETHHFCTTKSNLLAAHNTLAKTLKSHHLIFTTYHSLNKVNSANLDLDVVYFDEAHHSTKPMNHVGVARTSFMSEHCYFFTATPKTEMNHSEVYGSNLISISATELINAGTILPPKIETYEFDSVRTKENASNIDADNIINIVSNITYDNQVPKILVAAPSTQIIWEILSCTSVSRELISMGYVIMHITSKHGAYVNHQKVSREVFFEKLKTYGEDNSQKLIVFHYSILSEGINCPGLTHCIMLRNLPIIEMLQTIGRVIRLSQEDRIRIQNQSLAIGQYSLYQKPCGKIIIPVSKDHGANITKRMQMIVNQVFDRGQVLTT